jgi:HEPN domain-containing protein
MKKMLLHIFVSLLLITLAPGALFAQGGTGGGAAASALERELQRTDEFLDRAGQALGQGDIPQAVALLEQARTNQALAYDNFRGEHYILALRLTQIAREQAKTALGLAHRVEQYDGAVLRQLERAGDLLDRVNEALAEGASDNLRPMYETIRENLNRAWEFYRRQDYKPAYKLANQVEAAARKLLAALEPAGAGNQDFERRREHVQELFQDIRDQLTDCDSETAQVLLTQARTSYDLAQKLIGEGHRVQAMEALKQARQLVLKATRECQGGQQLEARYTRLQNEADRLAEETASYTGEGKEQLKALLDQARDQLQRARTRIDNGNPEAAAAALQAASLTLKQARSMLINE